MTSTRGELGGVLDGPGSEVRGADFRDSIPPLESSVDRPVLRRLDGTVLLRAGGRDRMSATEPAEAAAGGRLAHFAVSEQRERDEEKKRENVAQRRNPEQERHSAQNEFPKLKLSIYHNALGLLLERRHSNRLHCLLAYLPGRPVGPRGNLEGVGQASSRLGRFRPSRRQRQQREGGRT